MSARQAVDGAASESPRAGAGAGEDPPGSGLTIREVATAGVAGSGGDATDGIALQIRATDATGKTYLGRGEAVAHPGFSRPLEALWAAAEGLPGRLLGRVLGGLDDAERLAGELAGGAEEAVAAGEKTATAKKDGLPSPLAFAVDCALLDLLGQVQGRSVAALLAGEAGPATALVRNALVTTEGLGDRDPAALASDLRAAGWTVIKVKSRGLEGPTPELQRLAEALAASGGGGRSPLRLRIDCNGSLRAGHALAALRAFAELAVPGVLELDYIEEPVSGLSPAAWAGLVRGLGGGLRLAVDESAVSDAAWQAHLMAGAAAVAVIKPMFVGGLFAARRRAAEAAARGMEVVITSALEGAPGVAGAAHLGFSLGLSLALGIHARDGAELPAWLAGDRPELALPALPGLGLGEPGELGELGEPGSAPERGQGGA